MPPMPSSLGDWDPRGLPRGRGGLQLVQVEGHVELVLDNPAARNALSPGMMADLCDLVERLEAAPPAALLLHGGGEGPFCAGGDLKAVREHLLQPGAALGMARTMSAALDRLAALPTFLIAAVEGAALGGGAELLTACDLVIAAHGAKVGFVQARLGVSPGWGGGHRLVGRIGPRRALQALLDPAPPSAERAQELGLVDQLCPSGHALEQARRWARHLGALPEEAVRAAIRIARRGDPDEEIRLFGELWGGPAHLKALESLHHGRS